MLASYIAPDDYYGVDIQAEIIATAKEKNPDHFFSNKMPSDRKFEIIV